MVADREDTVESGEDGSGEPARPRRRRTQARARTSDSARRAHSGRCCHRRLKDDGRRWSRNGRRLVGSRRPAGRTIITTPAAGGSGTTARRRRAWDPGRDLDLDARQPLAFAKKLLISSCRLPPSRLSDLARRGTAHGTQAASCSLAPLPCLALFGLTAPRLV